MGVVTGEQTSSGKLYTLTAHFAAAKFAPESVRKVKDPTHPLPEVCRVLAAELATECATQEAELTTFICMDKRRNEKCVVVVAATERASDRLLEFLDSEREDGRLRNDRHTAFPSL